MLPDSDLSAPLGTDPEGRPYVVRAHELGMSFRTTNESQKTLKGTISSALRRKKTERTVHALGGVDFSVAKGSVYGVIGRNGAGKSTLFRLVAGILTPTSGQVAVYGHVTPLLSLGVGFNRELTGRENILLGGLASGLDPQQIVEQYHNILTFADLGEAIHSPMRTYSSGMFARLGFALAVHLDPDILLIDEALSAGDAKFKQRTTDKIAELAASDCTFLLVSHGLEIVRQLADQCLWLEGGKVRFEGPAEAVVDAYLANDGVAPIDASAMVDL